MHSTPVGNEHNIKAFAKAALMAFRPFKAFSPANPPMQRPSASPQKSAERQDDRKTESKKN